jgi:diguanylate cyclase (GGDEF)-like protein
LSSPEIKLDGQLYLINSVLRAVKVGLIVLDSEQRVVLWNQWMEQHSHIRADAAIGRSFIDIFPEMLDGRTHAAIKAALADNFASLISQTLNKTPFPLYTSTADEASGVRIQQAVQVIPIEVAALPRHCLVQITDVSMAVARDKKLREQAVEFQTQTFSDGLTGIANRRRFDLHLEDEFRRAKRVASPLSMIMMDVDHFKNYNDNYGHQRGDQCLILIAAALSRKLGRPCDLVARYGGEEFVAVLPDTNADGALKLAESMRAEVEALALEHAYSEVASHVTISLGVVTQIPQSDTVTSDLIGAADTALYRAKHEGRNCVVVFKDSVDTAR